jgi:hypothetical protein
VNHVASLHAAVYADPWNRQLADQLAAELLPLVGDPLVATMVTAAVVHRAKDVWRAHRDRQHLRLNAAAKRGRLF